MRPLRLTQRGDTIVEVLICVSILGFVVAAAYSLATRNQIATLKAQERARATGIVESQVESLRGYIEAKNNLAGVAENFCFVDDDSAAPLKFKPVDLTGSNKPKADRATDQVTNYGSDCTIDDLYKVSVWQPTADGSQDPAIGATLDNSATYAVTVRWETAGGGSFDEVKTYYTIHPRTTP